MYPHHVFNLEPAGTFGMYPICYRWVSGMYFQPEPAMYSRCFCQFPGPLTPSEHPIIRPLVFSEEIRQPIIQLTTGWLLENITHFNKRVHTPLSGYGHYPMTHEVISLFISA